MCFFGSYRHSVCEHTEYRVIRSCDRVTKIGEDFVCIPELPDAQRGIVGNVIQHNIVLPDRVYPGPPHPSQTQRYAGLVVQQAQVHNNSNSGNGAQSQRPPPGPNQYPTSGFCSDCAIRKLQAKTEPDFGLTEDMILTDEKMQAYFQFEHHVQNLRRTHANEPSNGPSTCRDAVLDYTNPPQPSGIADQNQAALFHLSDNNGHENMTYAASNVFNHNDSPMHRSSWFGRSHENGYQSGLVETQFSNNAQQQELNLYQNTQSNTEEMLPQLPTNYNPYDDEMLDPAMFPENRSRNSIVRNIGMPEDPFMTANDEQPVIPSLFQRQQGTINSGQPPEKKVRFEEPRGTSRNHLANTPSRYRPSKLESQALRLTKRRFDTATASRNTRETRTEVPRAEGMVPAQTRPRERPSAMQRLSTRWQSALRSRAKDSDSDATGKPQEPSER